MSESAKTLTYIALAAVMAVAGITLAPGSAKVKQDALEGLIGTEFYPKFTNPAEANSIEVVSYDPATATSTPFRVQFQNGLWRIPTRYNYPADAKDRLSKVAASVIGIKREALAGRNESEQAEFQVLDPQSEKTENLKGIGNRVTLKNDNTVLADFIIGKAVPNRAGYYYVRKPDEKPTYIAKVELNLSTKFTDWIESDVLALDGTKLSELDIIKHSLEIKGNRARLTGQERNILKRKLSSDPWTLEGLDTEKEEVNQDEVRKLVTGLDDLKIIAVRPKPESLRKGLSENEGISLDSQTEDDLASRGFYFQPTQRGGVQMISMEGDLIAGTNEAVEFEMHFGQDFEGTEEQIELDFVKTDAEVKKEGEAEQKDDEKSNGKKKGRFIFVTARVNPELLGPEPVEPTKPEEPTEEKPAEEKPAEEKKPDEKPAQEQPADEKPTDDKSSEDKPSDEQGEEQSEESATEKKATDEKPAEEKSTEEKSTEEKPAGEEKTDAEKKDDAPPEPPKVDPKKAYEDALKQYEADKLKYEADVKTRESKIKEANDKVKALNARFAEWYYVISAESFENLRQGRATLVKPKADAEQPKSETPAGDTPSKDEPAKDDSEKPADETPKEDSPKEDAPKEDAGEKQPEAKAEEAPSEEPGKKPE